MLSLILAACVGAAPVCYAGWWKTLKLADPCDVMAGRASREELASAAREAWNLAPSDAQCFADAYAQSVVAGRGVLWTQDHSLARAAALQWVKCLEKSPRSRPLWVALLENPTHELEPDDVRRLEKALSQLADATTVMDELSRLPNAPIGFFARIRLKLKPKQVVEVLGDPKLADMGALSLGVSMLDAARQRQRTFSEKEWLVIGEQTVGPALKAGYLNLSAELWKELPAPTRAGVFTSLAPELRVSLLLALCAEGHLAEARALEGVLELPKRTWSSMVDLRTLADAAHFTITKQRKIDPWEAFISYASAIHPTFLYEVFPLISRYLAPYADRAWTTPSMQSWDRPRGLLSDPVLAGRIDKARARAEARFRAVWPNSPRDAGVTPYELPPPAPSFEPFVESSVAPSSAVADAGRPFVPSGLPGDLLVRRAESSDAGFVALGMSLQNDFPGTWLLRSVDTKTWTELYVGWIPVISSSMPILRDGVVRIATLQGRPLEAPLSELSRDGDGDGLTDLLEMRLLLDSRNADMDGDGTQDGADSAPRVVRAPATRLGQALSGVFAASINFDRLGGRRVFSDSPRQVHFLIAEPADITGFDPPVRVVTLTESEWVAASKRFHLDPIRIQMTFSADGSQALARWNRRGDGSTWRGVRQDDGSWVFTRVWGWIS
ncbi:MAG: hypothetical protein ACYC8T_09555 [Myxococcaceae bacterium]